MTQRDKLTPLQCIQLFAEAADCFYDTFNGVRARVILQVETQHDADRVFDITRADDTIKHDDPAKGDAATQFAEGLVTGSLTVNDFEIEVRTDEP
jgi:hypothetical protein